MSQISLRIFQPSLSTAHKSVIGLNASLNSILNRKKTYCGTAVSVMVEFLRVMFGVLLFQIRSMIINTVGYSFRHRLKTLLLSWGIWLTLPQIQVLRGKILMKILCSHI